MESEILQNAAYSPSERLREKYMTIPVLLLLLYLLVEYGRPMFLAPIHPGLLVQGLLLVCLLPYGEKISKVLKEKYFSLYLLLLLFMLLHVFIADNYYYAFNTLKVMFSYFIIGLSCCVFIDSIQKLKVFLSAFILVVAICAVNRISGVNFLGISGGGVFADENDFSLAMNVALPIAFFLGRSSRGWKRWFFWAATFSFVLGTMVSASRGGFIGLMAVGIICWWSSKHRLMAVPALVLLAVLTWSFTSPLAKEEIRSIGLDSAEKDTGRDRIELWKVGLKIFYHNPVLGVGQGNIPVVMNKYRFNQWGESFWKRDMWGRMTHSVYLTLLPELGLIGLIIFVSMLKLLYAKKKQISGVCANMTNRVDADSILNLNYALMVSVFGFLITGIFLSVLYYPPLWNLSGLIIALFLISSALQKQQQTQPTA